MRHNVPVTDAAIAAGVHLVDLGSYYPETLQQLERHERAVAGRLPDRARLRCRARADQHPGPARRGPARHGRRRPPLLVHHPPDVDVAGDRRDPVRREHRDLGRPARAAGSSSARRSAARRRSSSRSRTARRTVHLVPHPEPVTLPRYLDVADVVFKVGYPADETRRIEVLLELGFDRDEPFELDGVADLAASLRRRLHRPARHRPDRPQRQRQAGPRRRHPRRPRRHPRLRLRGRAGRAVRLVGHHRHGRRDRGRPGGAGRAARRPSARGRVRRARRSSTALAERGFTIAEREVVAGRRAGPPTGRPGAARARRSCAGPGASARSGRTAAIARAPVGG